MNQPKTPGAMVLEMNDALALYEKTSGRHVMPPNISEHQDQFVHGYLARAAAEQTPAVGGYPEVIACAVFAKNGNIRCWSSDCTAVGLKASAEEGSPIVELIDRVHVAPLLAEIGRLESQLSDSDGNYRKARRTGVAATRELEAAHARIAELEAQQGDRR